MSPIRSAIAFLLVTIYGASIAAQAKAAQAVDLELTLAVDISASVDAGEAKLQRKGYIDAFRHPFVIQAIESGRLGRIAVTYFEWAGAGISFGVADWTVIKDRASAYAFANKLARTTPANAPGTSISGAIKYAVGLIKTNAFEGTRRVIDVSGDGPNNSGELVVRARDRAVAAGMTVNGLPIVNRNDGTDRGFNIPNLDLYYRHCVTGGPGAFVVVADSILDFARAVRRKLIREIADLPPPDQNPVAATLPLAGLRQSIALTSEIVPPCNIGEAMWQNRYLLE